MASFGVAQNDLPFPQSQNPGPSDRGLSVILSEDAPPEPSDSTELKNCVARHPPLACVLLTVTVKNEGRETVLTWWSTCGEPDMDFDLQKSDRKLGTISPAPIDYPDVTSVTSRRAREALPMWRCCLPARATSSK